MRVLAQGSELKSSEKLKKVLDGEKKIWYNAIPACEGRAPCKLNNVKEHEAPEEDEKFSSSKWRHLVRRGS